MRSNNYLFRKLLWIVLLPVAAAVSLIGYLLYTSPYPASEQTYRAHEWEILIAVLIAVLIAFALALSYTRSVSERIKALNRYAEGLLDPRLPEVAAPTSSDEVGVLAGSLRKMANQARDLVEQIKQESDGREAILASMVEGVLAVDQNLRVTFYNRSFQRLLGISQPRAELVPLVELVRDASLHEMLRQAIASEQSLNRRVELAGEEGMVLDAHAGPLGGAPPKGAILILHDITNLERLERIRKDFVANVSHELRTPLTAICGYTEMLLEGALEDRDNNRKFVEIIRNHANRINNIASDLLTLSELESPKKRKDPEPVSVKSALESALRIVETEAGERGVEVVRGQIDDAPVLGDKVHFEQAVVNLLQNAVKFNRTGGEVRLSAVASDGQIRIQVADTGVGIPSEDIPRIFERFFRVDKARSRDVGGTGLGLSIVKHAIERMKGSVTVESQLGKGSTFTILLPLTKR